jgi:MSHA pilin protein MshC
MTLMELVVVMVILGVIAVVAVPRLTDMTAVRDRGEYDEVLSTLQYARKTALSQRRYACVVLTSATVTLTADPNPPESTATPFGGLCPFANALALPVPDQAPCGANQLCLTNTTLTTSATSFQFDPQGRASTTVTVTVSGFPAITVEGETGYVH